MKYAQRLDYARLAEVLHDRGMADPMPLGEILQSSLSGGTPFAEALVYANLVSDWELARVVCEIFNLPFVTPDLCTPDIEVAKEIGADFLVQHGLVPMGRFGQVLSLAMPCLVPADVLGLLAAQSDLLIQPLVSTVSGNRRWLEEHLAVLQREDAYLERTESIDASWQNIFDDADAAVRLELDDEEEVGELDIDRELAALEAEGLELPAVEMSVPEIDSDEEFGELPRVEPRRQSAEKPAAGSTESKIELPPMPDFNLGDEPAA